MPEKDYPRAAGWRVPPYRWTSEIGPWAAIFILLLWPAAFMAGWIGIALLALFLVTAWNITRTVQARRSRRGKSA
ncbi:MAG: hypothetical protein ACRDJV_04525 [Actinomycetota bacterium]